MKTKPTERFHETPTPAIAGPYPHYVPCRGVISLDKRLEDPLLLIMRDADAGAHTAKCKVMALIVPAVLADCCRNAGWMSNNDLSPVR